MIDFSRLTVLVLDVDGVLTPGDVTYSESAGRIVSFNIHDGMAIRSWQRAGHRVAVLSGRRCATVERRCAELEIGHVHQGVSDKGPGFSALLAEMGIGPESVCYLGDDLPDVEPLRRSGFGVAVANAVPALKRCAAYVTRRRGGEGAVAECVDYILRKQRRHAAGSAESQR